MRAETIRGYTITAWGELVADHWHGVAAITPPIPGLWSGGPKGDSLVVDGMHSSEEEAVDEAMSKALESLAEVLSRNQSSSE